MAEFGPAPFGREAQGTDAASSHRRVSGAMVFGYFLPKEKVTSARSALQLLILLADSQAADPSLRSG